MTPLTDGQIDAQLESARLTTSPIKTASGAVIPVEWCDHQTARRLFSLSRSALVLLGR